jgi:hypothetical protein
MDWQHAITAALTAAVLAAFAGFAMRPAAAQSGDVVVLRYPKALRWFLLLAVAFFSAALIGVLWPLFAGNATDKDVRNAALGIPMSLLFIVFASCEGRVTLAVDHAGIGGRTAFRGQRRIAWCDVVDVRWSKLMFWFVLVDRHGTKVRVNGFLQGHAAVPARLREHVSEPVWRDAVAAWERTTSGTAGSR